MHHGAALRIGAGHWCAPERVADVNLVRLGRVHVREVRLLAAAIDDDRLGVERRFDVGKVRARGCIAGRAVGAEPLLVAGAYGARVQVIDAAVGHGLGGADGRVDRARLGRCATGEAHAHRAWVGAALFGQVKRGTDHGAAWQAPVDEHVDRHRCNLVDVGANWRCRCAWHAFGRHEQVDRCSVVFNGVVAGDAHVIQGRDLDLAGVRLARLEQVVILGRWRRALVMGAQVRHVHAVALDFKDVVFNAGKRGMPLEHVLGGSRGVGNGHAQDDVIILFQRILFRGNADGHAVRCGLCGETCGQCGNRYASFYQFIQVHFCSKK